MQWEIEYSLEADHYLEDNYPYTNDLENAIYWLAFRADGIPAEGCHQLEPGLYLWEVARHLVFYERILEEPPRLRILILKPVENI